MGDGAQLRHRQAAEAWRKADGTPAMRVTDIHAGYAGYRYISVNFPTR
jgi:hypothetical protein